MLEANGYEKYRNTESVFATKTSEDGKKTEREVLIQPKKRYGVLSNKTPEGQINSMMELFNDPENKDGRYCKIMIGSLVARDGISFFDVLRGYLLRAGWHPSGDLQALARILRAVSHEALKAEKQKRMSEEKIAGE